MCGLQSCKMNYMYARVKVCSFKVLVLVERHGSI